MLEIFLVATGFAIGRLFGSPNNQIDQANDRAEHMRQLWVGAEEKAESWRRRYLNEEK